MSEFAVEFVYSTADTNKDQKVSADEIRLAVPLYLALQVRNATSLDPDGGDSFAQHCADPARPLQSEQRRILDTFDAYDVNKDGRIDAAEMINILTDLNDGGERPL